MDINFDRDQHIKTIQNCSRASVRKTILQIVTLTFMWHNELGETLNTVQGCQQTELQLASYINQLYDNQIIIKSTVSAYQGVRGDLKEHLWCQPHRTFLTADLLIHARLSFLFPWSLSLLGQKVWLRHGESAYENIMSKHGSNRRWTLGIQSKAPHPWRSLTCLTHTAAAASSSCPLPPPPPPPVSFCPSN